MREEAVRPTFTNVFHFQETGKRFANPLPMPSDRPVASSGGSAEEGAISLAKCTKVRDVIAFENIPKIDMPSESLALLR